MADVETTTHNLSQLGLRAFPPEIIELIFAPVLTWTGKTPALIVALRGDQQLYQEALALFAKLNTFKLHRHNEWKTGDMGISALQSIRFLTVEFWSSDDWEEWDSSQVIEPCTHAFPSHRILYPPAMSIQHVHLNVCSLSDFNMKASLLPAQACLQRLPLLKEIEVALPRISYHRSDDDYDGSGLVGDLVEDFNACIGVRGKLRSVGAGCSLGEKMVWFWRDEGGLSLAKTTQRTRLERNRLS